MPALLLAPAGRILPQMPAGVGVIEVAVCKH
jgi:hypothetical protein